MNTEPGPLPARLAASGQQQPLVRARGKGYGREAPTLFTNWLFEHAGAQVVASGTNEANHAMRASPAGRAGPKTGW